MATLDTIIIIVIVIVGLFIMYKALKEPLDLLFGFIGKGLKAIIDKIASMKEGGGYEEIRYGG